MNTGQTKINFQEMLADLLSELSDREQDVLKQRYHLTSDLDKKATLKQIGDFYNITRERVRQIEKEAIRKVVELKEAELFAAKLKSLETDLVYYLERNGGLAREEHLLDNHAKENHDFDFFHTNAYLFVLEHLLDSVERVDNHDHFYKIWKLKELDLERVAALLAELEKHFSTEKKLYQQEELYGLAEEKASEELKAAVNSYIQKHNLELKDLLVSYLTASNRIETNILSEWGLAGWETVKPKKLSDKIKLIFAKDKNPLHFREIAGKINEAQFDRKKICAATVHNELIANGGYVLVGRGIYAPKDWGYVSGTVADIIESILKETAGPLSKQDIYDEVLKQRKVNKSTIYLTLINKDKFEKLADGRFSLSK